MFGCETLGDYHDLYVKTDVALHADVFENFRDVCMEKYNLDPAHYYTSPGLSWDALLKKDENLTRALDRYRHAPFRRKGNARWYLDGKQEARGSKQSACGRV